MKRHEVHAFLITKGIYISTGTISNRSLDFLLFFKQLHKSMHEKVKTLIERKGCMILHMDGTHRAGGQKGHPGTTLKMVDNPDEIRIIEVDQCSNCHTSLEDEEVKDYEKRQTFDIPPVQLYSTEHRGEIKLCPKYGCLNTAKFPDDVTQPAQYGSRLRSLAVDLHDYQFIPYDRGCEFSSDIFRCDISPATLIRAETECFEEFDNALKEALKQSPEGINIHL